MKKYWLIGFSTLCLSLFLLLVVANDVYAQDPTETPTTENTPTLEIDPFFKTKTPLPLGDCPIDCVIDNGQLTYEYSKNCASCICTKTPPFPTKTLIPSTHTPTPLNFTPTVTPTVTSTPMGFGNMIAYRYSAPTIYTGEQLTSDVWYEKEFINWSYSGNPSPGFQVRPLTNTNHVTYIIGGGFVYEGTLGNNSSFDEKINLKIVPMEGDAILKFYVGQDYLGNNLSDLGDITINKGSNYTVQVFKSSKGGYYSGTFYFDITYTTNSTHPTSLRGVNAYFTHNLYSNGNNTNLQYKWAEGGIYNYDDEPTPTPVVGMCTNPEEKVNLEDNEYFNGGGMYWVGTSSCLDLTFMQAIIANETIQNWLEGIIEIEVTPSTLNLCFRQFTILPLQVAGISVDIITFLYVIVGAWAVLTVIGGLTQ